MSNPRRRLALTTSMFLIVLSATVPAMAAGAIDAGLYTTYSFYNGFVTVDWVVCGQTHGWYGCYASGSLGPFGNVGALMEGNPSTKGNTVTRALYIVDVGTGSGVNSINLYIYKKVDTITPPNDSVTITLTKTVQLPLVGGTGASSSLTASAIRATAALEKLRKRMPSPGRSPLSMRLTAFKRASVVFPLPGPPRTRP